MEIIFLIIVVVALAVVCCVMMLCKYDCGNHEDDDLDGFQNVTAALDTKGIAGELLKMKDREEQDLEMEMENLQKRMGEVKDRMEIKKKKKKNKRKKYLKEAAADTKPVSLKKPAGKIKTKTKTYNMDSKHTEELPELKSKVIKSIIHNPSADYPPSSRKKNSVKAKMMTSKNLQAQQMEDDEPKDKETIIEERRQLRQKRREMKMKRMGSQNSVQILHNDSSAGNLLSSDLNKSATRNTGQEAKTSVLASRSPLSARGSGFFRRSMSKIFVEPPEEGVAARSPENRVFMKRNEMYETAPVDANTAFVGAGVTHVRPSTARSLQPKTSNI